MPQLFSRSADTILRTSLVGGALLIGLAGFGLLALARSPYMTNQDVTVEQPIPFSHQHHVADIGIDCRYCHQSVEFSARAGMPSTEVCMTCHRQLWDRAEMLAPVRISYRKNTPLRWNRVHDLPDYVYFNHSIHIHQGIGCFSCHGDVSEMPLMRRAKPLTMQWCLDCHRAPQQHVRPRDLVFQSKPLESLLNHDQIRQERADAAAMSDNKAAVSQLQQELFEEYQLKSRTACYTCHR